MAVPLRSMINNTQIVSLISAGLAVLVGLVAGFLGWMSPVEALGLCMVGLSILGVHVGGSVAGSNR